MPSAASQESGGASPAITTATLISLYFLSPPCCIATIATAQPAPVAVTVTSSARRRPSLRLYFFSDPLPTIPPNFRNPSPSIFALSLSEIPSPFCHTSTANDCRHFTLDTQRESPPYSHPTTTASAPRPAVTAALHRLHLPRSLIRTGSSHHCRRPSALLQFPSSPD